MSKKTEKEKLIDQEAEFGIVPVTTKAKQYKFSDAFLFMSSYAIATWNYTQGAYITGLVGFKQMLITTIFGSLIAMLIMQLPAILATRYGIDIWIWIKGILGHTGVKVATITIVILNFTWHAVVAELFASSFENLFSLAGIQLPQFCHLILALVCIFGGAYIALRGIIALNITTKLLTPLLLLVGCVVMYVGLSSAPLEVIWNYVPEGVNPGDQSAAIGYILASDAMIAYCLAWFGGMAGIPRLTYTERSGYWAGPIGSGLTGAFFMIIGSVMAIAMQYVTGEMVTDPTIMLATLSVPAMALCSLLLVGFANIGTQATGSYLYALMLKASFKKTKFAILLLSLCIYISILAIWGQILDYIGAILSMSACMFAPLAALLFADFFFVRKQKFSFRAAYEIDGNKTYRYFHGFNPVGVGSLIVGFVSYLLVMNPITQEVRIPFLFQFTPCACSFVATMVTYLLLNCIPAVRRYNLRDRKEVTV